MMFCLSPINIFDCTKFLVFFDCSKLLLGGEMVVNNPECQASSFSELQSSPGIILWFRLCSSLTIWLANQPITAPAVSHVMNLMSSICFLLLDCCTISGFQRLLSALIGFQRPFKEQFLVGGGGYRFQELLITVQFDTV